MDNVIGNGVEKVVDGAAEHVVGAAVDAIGNKGVLKYVGTALVGAVAGIGAYQGVKWLYNKGKTVMAEKKAAEAEPVEAEATEE